MNIHSIYWVHLKKTKFRYTERCCFDGFFKFKQFAWDFKWRLRVIFNIFMNNKLHLLSETFNLKFIYRDCATLKYIVTWSTTSKIIFLFCILSFTYISIGIIYKPVVLIYSYFIFFFQPVKPSWVKFSSEMCTLKKMSVPL